MNRVSGIGAGWIVATVALACAVTVVAQPPSGPGGPEGGGPPGGGPRRGPPSPERFVEHAMTFDADGDGKLDRAELTKFAEDIQAMRMRGGPGGPGGFQGGGQRGGPGGGRGPRGGGPGGAGGSPSEGERPERPRRPE